MAASTLPGRRLQATAGRWAFPLAFFGFECLDGYRYNRPEVERIWGICECIMDHSKIIFYLFQDGCSC